MNNDRVTPRPYASRRGQTEPVFHPQLRRTKEVIRRPEWVRRTGEGVAHRGSLSSIALFGILFANCVGGGYGFEDGIGTAGPLITLIVCLVLPWVWSLPTGLAVAELSTAVPSNSGVLMWTNAAFPPFISFLCILGTIFITFIGNATYPNLTAEYVANLTDLNAGEVAAVKIGVVVLCCVLNCVGVEIVGNSSIVLCAITILPFMLLTVIRLFSKGFNEALLYVDLKNVEWSSFFSIISWNYANIENAGSVVEEIANPRRSLPKAMVMLMFGTYVAYVMPMLAGVSEMGVGQDYSQWQAGHWPDVALRIAGPWLKYMLFSGAILSGVGFTLTAMCCTSRLIAGMGTMEMFPKKISRVIGYYHPRLGTPIPSIVLNSVVTLVFSVSLDFGSVVSLCQSLYCLRLLLIYAALVKLRIEYPNLARPYALPCNTWLAALSLVPAALFSLFAAIMSAMTSFAIGMALVGFVVGGSALSWGYCRIFAKNGFQGVIVQCEVSDTDDDDASVQDDPEALGEGVFYHDGQNDIPGDLLLGILPLTNTEQQEPAGAGANGEAGKSGSGIPGVDGPAYEMDADGGFGFVRRNSGNPAGGGTGDEIVNAEYTSAAHDIDGSLALYPPHRGLRRRIGRREEESDDRSSDEDSSDSSEAPAGGIPAPFSRGEAPLNTVVLRSTANTRRSTPRMTPRATSYRTSPMNVSLEDAVGPSNVTATVAMTEPTATVSATPKASGGGPVTGLGRGSSPSAANRPSASRKKPPPSATASPGGPF